MDKISRQLVDFTRQFDNNLGPLATDSAISILFDTVACAVAGMASEPAAIVARVAPDLGDKTGATIFGHRFRTSPEIAALANTMMVRTYDYNDAYFGHPSDMIAGVLTAGEIAHSSGKEVLTAIALAYEIYGAFSRSTPYHLDTWLDQGAFMNVGVALAVGKLWGLNDEQLANAASLALVPNLPMGVVRWGTLSMIKGGATAFAARNGVFAAMLAQKGFTSSPNPYEGLCGLHEAIGAFDLRLPLMPDGTKVIELPYVKPIPAENNTIPLLELVPSIRDWTSVDAIDSIEIEVAAGLEVHMADEPKYDPKTRESADHSLPYVLARALVDGGITLDSYTPERIADPAIRPLMRKIRVRGNEEMKAIMRASRGTEAKPARIRVTSGGREFLRVVLDHSGHPQRPAQARRDMLNRKLDLCARHADLADERRERIRQAWWDVAHAPDIGPVIRTLAEVRE